MAACSGPYDRFVIALLDSLFVNIQGALSCFKRFCDSLLSQTKVHCYSTKQHYTMIILVNEFASDFNNYMAAHGHTTAFLLHDSTTYSQNTMIILVYVFSLFRLLCDSLLRAMLHITLLNRLFIKYKEV